MPESILSPKVCSWIMNKNGNHGTHTKYEYWVRNTKYGYGVVLINSLIYEVSLPILFEPLTSPGVFDVSINFNYKENQSGQLNKNRLRHDLLTRPQRTHAQNKCLNINLYQLQFNQICCSSFFFFYLSLSFGCTCICPTYDAHKDSKTKHG